MNDKCVRREGEINTRMGGDDPQVVPCESEGLIFFAFSRRASRVWMEFRFVIGCLEMIAAAAVSGKGRMRKGKKKGNDDDEEDKSGYGAGKMVGWEGPKKMKMPGNGEKNMDG